MRNTDLLGFLCIQVGSVQNRLSESPLSTPASRNVLSEIEQNDSPKRRMMILLKYQTVIILIAISVFSWIGAIWASVSNAKHWQWSWILVVNERRTRGGWCCWKLASYGSSARGGRVLCPSTSYGSMLHPWSDVYHCTGTTFRWSTTGEISSHRLVYWGQTRESEA